jgi:hypothetical protein
MEAQEYQVLFLALLCFMVAEAVVEHIKAEQVELAVLVVAAMLVQQVEIM